MSGPLLTVAGTGGSVAGAGERDDVLCVAYTGPAPACESRPPGATTTVPSLLILGTDAVLAARPATPVQLAHACSAAGFDVVVPATWGDEIIARGVAERAREASAPLLQCSCPLVARRFVNHVDALGDTLLHFVPPPVATARYLRKLYGTASLHITYAGDCPMRITDAIDTHISCRSLLETLSARGVTAISQPTAFDSVLTPDRRRHFSQPGGVPGRDALQRMAAGWDIVELFGEELEIDLAQRLLSDDREIVDVAPAMGCRCSGVVEGVAASEARRTVREHEPPLSPVPVLDHDLAIHVIETLVPAAATAPPDHHIGEASPQAPDDEPGSEPALVTVDPPVRRRSPPGSTRAVLGTMPLSRAERGRPLPRAYVARRRSSPRGGLRQSGVRREEPVTSPAALSRLPRWLLIAVIAILAIVVAIAARSLG